MNTTKKGLYAVDLARHLSECEMNYARLLRLLPGLHDGVADWQIAVGGPAAIHVQIRLRESAPYTSLIDVVQTQSGETLPPLQIRLCHDAAVAEIVSWGKHRHWQPHYDYPNPLMYYPDEKVALNRFLGDWLAFCRNQGRALSDICDSVRVTGKF